MTEQFPILEQQQKLTPFEGDLRDPWARLIAANAIRAGEAITVDNDAVWAVWGNPEDSRFLETVHTVKERDPNRPYGLSVPFRQFMPLVDSDKVSPRLLPLLENPELMTDRLGAAAFVRAPGNAEMIKKVGLPTSLYTLDEASEPVLQNYDPAGRYYIEEMIREAQSRGVRFPGVTSFNVSGEPEGTLPEEVIPQARNWQLPIFADIRARRLIRGSYPIIGIGPENHLTILREGNIGNDILVQLLDGYEVAVAADMREAKYPPLHLSDIPHLQHLSGPELRRGLLDHLGWRPLQLPFQRPFSPR